MASPNEFRLADLKEKYAERAGMPAFARLYEDDPEFGHMFSVQHQRLNEHFDDINDRALSTHHYWAENSRDLLALIRELNDDLYELKRAGVETRLAASYQEALERCKPWLSSSGGSTVPADFGPIGVIRYEPVFSRATDTIRSSSRQTA